MLISLNISTEIPQNPISSLACGFPDRINLSSASDVLFKRAIHDALSLSKIFCTTMPSYLYFSKTHFFHACVAPACPRMQIIKLENENLVLIKEIEFLERYSDQSRK